MRRCLTYAFVLATALAAPLTSDLNDDTCEPDLINAGEGSSPIASAVVSTPSGVDTGSHASKDGVVTVNQKSAMSSSTNDSSISMSTRPDGSAGLPVNEDHISAPVDTRRVPDGAAIYTPYGDTINCTDFVSWMNAHRTADLASKYLKVSPGVYSYDLGNPHALDADANLSPGNNIVLWLFSGGWTLDLRNVTFLISITPENANRRPTNMIYIDESDDLTILGGTIWIDQGEQFTQARLTSLSPSSTASTQLATFTVEKGYNVSAWSSAGPRNQGCIDSSFPAHFKRPQCNFWKVENYDFSHLTTTHTFTTTVLPGSQLQTNYVIYLQSGPNSLTTISSENNANLHVKGITTNGAIGQIGLNDKKTATFEDYYYVNPPPRPGYAERVNGPTLSWGHIGEAVAYDTPGQAEIVFVNTWWQYTGCRGDLQSAGNETLPVD